MNGAVDNLSLQNKKLLDFGFQMLYFYANKNQSVTKVITLLVCISALIFGQVDHVYAQSNNYTFQHLTPKQGLPHLVYSVLKDSTGFMWFATINGLYRYDGQHFKSYRYQPDDSSSISGNKISSFLFEDNDGCIWVGTAANGLNKFNRNTESFQRFKHNPNNPGSLSSMHITKLFQDRSGTIWIASDNGLNKYHPKTEEFSVYKPDPNHLNSKANTIKSIYEDRDGILWVGTNGGIYHFSRRTKTFQKLNELSEIQAAFPYIAFRDIAEDNEGVLWFATNSGLIRHDKKTKQIKRYKHQENNPKSIIDNDILSIVINPDDGGNILWMATTGGLVSFNRRNEHFSNYTHDPRNSFSLGSNILWGVYLDKSGTLWIPSENAGIDYIHLRKNPFLYYDLQNPNGIKAMHSATSFCKDSNGNLWVGGFLSGLFQFDPQMKPISHQDFGGKLRKKLTLNYIRCIYEDSKGILWLGNSGGGLYKYDRLKKLFVQIPFEEKKSNVIFRIFEDSYGILWISSDLGLLVKDNATGRIVYFYDRNNSNIQSFVNSNYKFYEDSEKCLWISTHGNGVFMLSPENRRDMLFTNFKHEPSDPNSISSNTVNTVREDADKNLWLATSRGINKFDRHNKQFKSIDSKNGLGADYIYHFEADNSGNLLLSTENGLLMFDPSSSQKQKSRALRTQDGLPFDDVFPYFLYKDKFGKFYVGGGKDSEKGFFVFNPDSLQKNEHTPPIVLTGFKIRNQAVKLDSSITELNQVYLKHNQNYFSFDFASLDYVNPTKNLYAFMLEGYDQDWIYPGNRGYANYTSVPPGDYTFRVKGSNNDGLWNEQGTSIGVNIAKPPWNTWWSNVIYAMVVFALFYAWRRYDLKRQQLKQELEIEQLESERLTDLDKIKSRFFANISHEFRTPLTLIIGPLAKLLDKTNDKSCVEDLGIIQRNALRLQKLIDQLLSLTKLESGNMKLQTKEEDLIPLIKGYIQSFSSLAKEKEITLSFRSRRKKLAMLIDRDKLEKIMFNLLSNAFKFTDKKGQIKIEVNTFTYAKNNRPGIKIKVRDTGPGIAADRIPYIFNRFYQAEGSSQQMQAGTGIGLSLTKELVNLHLGKIWVDSEKGKGAVFSVFLPFDNPNGNVNSVNDKETDSVEKETPGKDEVSFVEEDEKSCLENTSEINQNNSNTNIPIVLIVEDNADMRTFIKGYLNDVYHIIEAADGEEGLATAIAEIPDLVISDVMMPKMDGNEMCDKLKTDERTSHIPIIILTAKAGSDSKIEGLEAGADAYLTKPFDGKELLIRVKNLIKQRQKIREFFSNKIASANHSPLANLQDSGISSMDQQFIEKAVKVVEENMTNPDFSVEMFGREMALSRVQLHRKLKAIVNQSASTFVRTLRLQRAALLLSKQAGNVTEIAYDVGFNNLSYFAKCFHEKFGVTPSEFSANNPSPNTEWKE